MKWLAEVEMILFPGSTCNNSSSKFKVYSVKNGVVLTVTIALRIVLLKLKYILNTLAIPDLPRLMEEKISYFERVVIHVRSYLSYKKVLAFKILFQ